ncbi:acetate/propionate family kinase [Planctomicrobium sp. SH668]|uniref:acetate/propionate family kinase n=1 Tax=Planctomicrobium sp. SH668 TaxID=3448126 RepID=UPI003F5B9A9F
MKVLVANLGSTSFKYRLFDMSTEEQLARGAIDRIGQDADSVCTAEVGSHKQEVIQRIPDHAAAVRMCLDQLTHPETGCLTSVDEVAAIGFKAVFAGRLSGIRLVNDELLETMESLADVAPAHNPPYARAMRLLKASFPKIPLVAALETAFHDTILPEYRSYAVPYEWTENHEIRRWGFHGASHRFIATRTAQLLNNPDAKIISCHLGGSSSICAIERGESRAASMGMTPQSGLPQNNRVGDFDPFALRLLKNRTGKDYETLLNELASQGGLQGMSGVSPDLRDIENAAAQGHERANHAIRVYVAEIKKYIGQYLAVLNGADAIVFTGGIGENSSLIRKLVCENMTFAGIELDQQKNETLKGEVNLSSPQAKTQVWIVPTNEEIVVARQTAKVVGENIR